MCTERFWEAARRIQFSIIAYSVPKKLFSISCIAIQYNSILYTYVKESGKNSF